MNAAAAISPKIRGVTMPFIQIIELTTTRPDEVEALTDEWAAKTEGRRQTARAVLTADRDRPNTYIQIVEFHSYQQAMTNSDLPETSEFADGLAGLCDTPPQFRNLDVRRQHDLS
jgi:hypothetical protein